MKRSVVLPLIVINVVVFGLQVFLGPSFTELFLLNSQDVWSRPWILLTSMFLHGDVMHLLFNMYALFLFGSIIEPRIGRDRFLVAYFGTGLIAALATAFFYDRALGASGAVMGVIGITMMLMPNLQLLFMGFVPMRLWTAGLIFAAIDILGIFVPSGIANIAHLAGLCSGLLYGRYLKSKRTSFHKKFHEKSHVHHTRNSHKESIELSQDEINDFIRNGRL